MKSNLAIVLPSDLKIELKVIDFEGVKGVVTEFEDYHNVFVEFDNGGGHYCFAKGCDENSELIYPLFKYPN